jgi:hypothetical protein
MQQFEISTPVGFAMPADNEELTASLKALLSLDHTAVTSALQYENKPKFGPSAISNLQVNVVRYDAINLKGRVRFTYDMQLTFGCEDVIKDHLNQHSYYNFELNTADGLLRLESDAPELPSTADEF